ncbi:MAG: hypothetical protein RR942_08790 [Romboutsia sp.]
MNNKLNIIIDVSGSMAENGKKDIVIYAYDTINNLLDDKKYNKEKIILSKWEDKETKMKKVFNFEFDNSYTTEEFKKYFKDGNKSKSNIILSDGSIELKNILKNKDENTICIFIKIGIDADTLGITKYISKSDIYDVCDIVTAFDKAYNYVY